MSQAFRNPQDGQNYNRNHQGAGPQQKQKQIKIDPNDLELMSISKWNKLRQDVKIRPAYSLRITNPNRESDCYRLTPKGLDGLNYSPKSRETKRLAIKFNFSFYSNQLKEFFGRSYLTGAYGLRSEQQGYNYQFEYSHPFSLFFHTQLEKSAATLIIFEAYILEIGNHDIILSTFSCGVGEININNLLKEPQSVALKNNTMRGYVSKASTEEQRIANTSIRFNFILDYFPLLQKIKHLFPESVLVSTNDPIPGLAEQWLDTKFQENQTLKIDQVFEIMMDLLPTYKLYLVNVQILIRDNVEKELVRQVQQFLEVSKSINNKVIFKEKKLICGFHNGWDFVNRGGGSNRVTLKQQIKEVIKNKDGQDSNVISLEYSGMHEIDNVFDSDQSCIVLQLEYDIEYVAQARQIATRVISWLPISVSGKLQSQSELIVQEVMLHGPGKSVDGQKMISLPFREEFEIQVSAGFRVVPPGTNENNLYEEIQKARVVQQDYRSQQMQSQQDQSRQPGQPVHQAKPLPFPQQQLNRMPTGADLQLQMLDQQLMNERRRLEQINDQILQRRQLQNAGGAPFNIQDYQQITWEPRNEQERYLKQLQQQEMMMKQQIEQFQRERDQIQMGLTQEYKMMREELVKTRQSASAPGFYKKATKIQPVRQSPQKQQGGYNYENDLDEDEIIEGRQLDFNPIRSQVTYQGEKDQPLIIHLNQPMYGKRELSQKDKLELINQGVTGLLDDIPPMNTKEQYADEKTILEEDMKDQLKAQTVIFRIFSIKPDIYQGLPKRMFLTFNFFDFPKYKTESFSYESKDDQNAILKMIENKSPLLVYREAFFKGEEEKFMSFKFDIDPSKSKYNDLFKDFIKYLIKKQLHVDIWDADTQMLYGSFKIPLHKIRRQGQNKKTTQLDLDIVNPNFVGYRGSIQIQIDNIGKEEAFPNKRKDQEYENKINSVNQWQNKQTDKIKVISDSQITIPINYIKNQRTNNASKVSKLDDQNNADAGVRSDEQVRKVERVKRFKNNTLNQAAMLFNEDDQTMLNKISLGYDISKIKELSQHRITQIDEIKSKKKPDFVKSVISKFLNEEKVLSVSYGRQEIVPYLLQNPTATIQTFSIIIEDADEDILNHSEFEPVTDSTEWKYWISALNLTELPSYDIIQGNTLVLEPNQKVHVLFKFMTYRNIDPQLKDKQDAERISQQRDAEYRQKHINPRSINVFFSLKQQTIVGGFRIKVEPHQQIIDHIFRYYERATKTVNITLPPLYLKDQAPMLKPTLHVTDNKVAVEWVNEQEIAIYTKMPNISKIMRFNILVYNSDLRSNLLSNIQVELHGLEGVDVHVNMGQTTQFKLNLPGDIPRVVQLYSSMTNILWFSSPYDTTFTLPPGKITQIETAVKSLSTGSQRIQVNAVDVHSNELIHSWIVRIETDIPKPNKVFELTATALKESIQVFEYRNKSQKTKTFQFLSSDPSILEVLDPSKQILGNSGEEIAVRVVPREYKAPEAQVIIFASDYDETVFDTMKFRIRYIFNDEAQSLQAFNRLKQQKDMILQQQAQQSMNLEDQQHQIGYQSGNNFYNNNDPYYQSSSNWQNDDGYGNQGNYQPNDSRYGQNSFYNDGRRQNNYEDNRRYQGNYQDYGQNNNQYNYQQNYDENPKRRGNSNQNYDNQYQDYGRNQPSLQRGGASNYDDYNARQGNNNNNYDQYNQGQQNRQNKKVKFDQQQNYNNYGRNNYNQY
ncbi:nephronophthisis protein, putative (macronuclear) [Tetrahymena thermophila SB210]|uniref:Nephronophthisis protein, putative n=1 Tax=Tetrahymena thermophila (strain SB210) TaxID=312017 RepID=Q23AY0_TETTS|nr:nephronophthisis protein, putative [Tetrahymena thermophila SB210]EAR93704.2 nephronophthisis protein, putative [Tetrahymena thermophila SB210]|eukprot:XP_001013949.2 nephronophthisis protein, putative [Tetrahymena thermophila SB210]